jgi:hypothetical protein
MRKSDFTAGDSGQTGRVPIERVGIVTGGHGGFAQAVITGPDPDFQELRAGRTDFGEIVGGNRHSRQRCRHYYEDNFLHGLFSYFITAKRPSLSP